MLKNMQWRAGLIVINHARQKDRTVFSAKKSNYSKIGKLYRLCQIKKKVMGESVKYYKALFKKFLNASLFSSLLWRVPISSWNILFRILTAHCTSYRGAEAEIKVHLLTWSIILTLSIDFDRFCPHFGSFKTMLIFPIQDGIKVAAFGIVKLILPITS